LLEKERESLVPSFLEEEFQYMKQASTTFPEAITPSIQMSCMKAYQKAMSDASRRLPCGLCGVCSKRKRCSTSAFKTRIYYTSLKKPRRSRIVAQSRTILLACAVSVALQLRNKPYLLFQLAISSTVSSVRIIQRF
jgi:hypothetical protein